VRVAVDARHLAGGRGVATYSARLLAALASGFPQDEWALVAPGRGALRVPPGTELHRTATPQRAVFAAAALAGRPTLDGLAGGADVAFVPTVAPVAVGGRTPLVLAVHDLSFVERPGDFTRYERLWHRLARPHGLARRATWVLASSEATRDALTGLWDLDAVRIVVVPLGVTPPDPPAGAAAVRARLGVPARYLLFVGALEPRKAPGVLLEGFARAREQGLAASLVLAGAGRSAPDPVPDGVLVLGGVDDAQRDALYAGALGLVLPSWVEGFGLPPLEALAAGVAPVVSDLPVFRETLGDAALRFPAGDAWALADKLLALDRDAGLRARLVARGAPRVRALTWERTARATHAVLVEAAGA
jgi:glycosyltransferase involved in cell wall biosynthesis